MPRPQTVSDAQINAAAREVFLARGPSAPVSAVAARLGVSAAALLQRAGSKEALLAAALGAPPELPPLPATGDLAALVAVLTAWTRTLRQALPALAALRASGVPVDVTDPPPARLRRALAGWIGAHQATRAPASVAEGLLGALEARCLNDWIAGAPPADDDTFVAALVAGLLGEDR